MPGGLLSAISGILAGGILGFGAAVRIVFGHLRKILPSGPVVFFCCCARSRNSLAHKLPDSLEQSWSVLFSLGFVGVGVVGFVFLFLCFLFSGLTRLRTA